MGWISGRVQAGLVTVGWADAATAKPGDLDVLGTMQVRRHGALAGLAAQRFALGRLMLAELVDELAPGVDLTLDSTCNRCGEDHGRPRFTRAPVVVSVSYSGSMVAVAAAHRADAAAVGVDLESEGATLDLATLFAPQSPPSLSGWTQLEAAVKADGRGVTIDLAEVRIEAHNVWLPGRENGIHTETHAIPGYVISSAILLA